MLATVQAMLYLDQEGKGGLGTVCPDWAIFYTFGNFSKPRAIIILPKSPTHFRHFF